jgi:hypothetical protein
VGYSLRVKFKSNERPWEGDVQDRILLAMSKGTKEVPLTDREVYANHRLRDIAEYVDTKMTFIAPEHRRVKV